MSESHQFDLACVRCQSTADAALALRTLYDAAPRQPRRHLQFSNLHLTVRLIAKKKILSYWRRALPEATRGGRLARLRHSYERFAP